MENRFGVAVKAIIGNEKGQFLVLYKSEIEEIGPGKIDLPGGRMQFGEDIAFGREWVEC